MVTLVRYSVLIQVGDTIYRLYHNFQFGGWVGIDTQTNWNTYALSDGPKEDFQIMKLIGYLTDILSSF